MDWPCLGGDWVRVCVAGELVFCGPPPPCSSGFGGEAAWPGLGAALGGNGPPLFVEPGVEGLWSRLGLQPRCIPGDEAAACPCSAGRAGGRNPPTRRAATMLLRGFILGGGVRVSHSSDLLGFWGFF